MKPGESLLNSYKQLDKHADWIYNGVLARSENVRVYWVYFIN